nr:hypothetical protein [Tanacetum cinerariifolium]GFC23754.1 hypothetical protein [Tanacetum cinerariifolium]
MLVTMDLSSSIHPPVTTATIPTVIPNDNPPLRQYTRRARIAQSSALPTVADEPASPFGDDSQGKACPTVSGLEAEQDMANIIKTSTLPHDSPPRVTSLTADEGSLQHKLNELMDLCTCLQRDAEITKIYVEKELQMMIDGLDRSNEMIAKHLHKYEQAAAELTIREKIKLINELVKYQDHHSKILKYQAQ